MEKKSSFKRISELVVSNKKEVVSIYLFSMLSGLVNLSLPLGVQTIIGLVLGATMVTSIYVLITLVVLGVFIVGVLQVNQMKIIERVQQKLFTEYAFEFANRLPKFDLKKTDHYFIPEKINRFFDTVNIQKGFAKLLLDIPIASVQIVLGIILLCLYHPLFIILGLVLILILGLILKFTSAKGVETSIEESNYKYKVVGFFGEMARTLKSFKSIQNSRLNLSKTDKNVEGYLAARTKHFKILLFQYKALIFFKVSLSILMLTLGTYLLLNQQLNIGEFIAAEIVILMVIAAVEKLIVSLDSLYDVITGLEKLASVTELPLESTGDLNLAPSQAVEIKLEKFSFQFNSSKRLLDSISVHILPGQKVSVSGEEGSGKSLFLRILTGNYQDFEGSFLINQIPIHNFNLTNFRGMTGVLFQGQEIFEGTIWENISLGNQDVSSNEIMELAQKLGIEDFIVHFKNGFDHVIEPIGKKTPHSTIRKILLLRALSGKKNLLLLDHPWNGLEASSAEKIKNYLLSDHLQSTCVIISNDQAFNQKTALQLNFKNGKSV
jgi:ABC-type bacteriocin/lantibiotic exporter with double-glycine peptidase domain